MDINNMIKLNIEDEKKPELSETPTTSLESAASNTSDDKCVINVEDKKEQKKLKSHFDEEFDPKFDEEDKEFPPYQSRLQRIVKILRDNVAGVINISAN